MLEAGHETLILDYSTVDTIKRMVPQKLRATLADAYEDFLSDMRADGKLSEKTSNRLIELDGKLEQHREGEFIRIADEIINKIEEVNADFIGFKLWTGDGFYGSEKIARYIRGKYPDLKIFAGGPHVDWFKENILHYTDIFDAIAYGEGEETINLLAEYVEGKRKLSDVPNLIYKQNVENSDEDVGEIKFTDLKRGEDLNLLPDPIYDDEIYPTMKGNQKIKFIMIDESRGCPNACHFCIHPIKSGNRWRLRDVTKIVDLMERLGSKLDTNAFRFAGSNTPAHLKNELALEITRRGLKVRYASFGHVRDMEKCMIYRIRFLLPPALWEPVPYRIGGKTHYEAIAMAQWLATELEKKWIITGIEDNLLFVASHLNISPKEAREKNKRLFFTGDYLGIERMVNMLAHVKS